ncbi:MAG: hypothetical protein ACRDD1_19825, partial [Planctomycetia bacterium]
VAALFAVGFQRLAAAGVHPLPALLAGGVAVVASSLHFIVRPHVFTMLFVFFAQIILTSVDAGRWSLRALWLLPPLVLLWTNLHGGALSGVGMAGLAAGGWLLFAALNRISSAMPQLPTPVKTWRDAVFLPPWLAATTAVVFVNPYGADLPRLWVDLSNSDVLKTVITENAPLKPTAWESFPILLLGSGYVLLLACLPIGRWRASYFLPLVWFAMALNGVRHAPLFAVAALAALPDLLPGNRLVERLTRGGDLYQPPPDDRPPDRWSGWLVPATATGFLGAVLALQAGGLHAPLVGLGWAGRFEETVPIDALPALKTLAAESPPDAALFNHANYSGFIIYYAPTLRHFMDDRWELYRDAAMLDYVQGAGGDPGRIERWDARCGFVGAIVRNDTPFDRWLADRADWRRTFRGATASVYARRREDGP